MWSYVVAARGDQHRRPGSVFTVQSVGAGKGGPGPCRDGLTSTNCSAHPLTGYTRKDGIARGYSKDELTANATLSRDGSTDMLAEVQVNTPLTEGQHSGIHSQVIILNIG
ncbi:hypothetical protein JTB14_006245 [Gonioctena quinquepunctata]|nr:hypothetical protein JTB14_006245 [Gonioctena quinquepunctata]